MKYALLASLLILISSLSFASPQLTTSPTNVTNMTLPPQVVLKSYMGMVEEYLLGVLRNQRLIALTNEAQTKNWNSVKPLLMQLSKDLSTEATVWYALPDGNYYSTETDGLTKQNIKDRDYFQKLMQGQDIIGHLVVSKSTGHRSIVIATPVLVNKKVVAAIGVSVRLRLLSTLVESRTQLPQNTYFYAMNSDAKIAIHRYEDRMFKQVHDVGDEILEKQFKELFNKDRGLFDYVLNGKKMTSIFEKAPQLGWYFFIAQEQAVQP